MLTRSVLAAVLAASLSAAMPTASWAEGFDQAGLIRPVKKKLMLVFIPKVVHPWYDVVQQGAKVAVAELAKEGIDVDFVWDAPAQADVAEQNRRLETDIGRKPDGIAFSCLDPATNSQLLGEALERKINLVTFDTSCGGSYPFIGHRADEQDGRDMADFLAKQIGDAGKVGILSGSLTAPNHVARVKGFKDQLATKHPKVTVVFERPDNDNLETAVSLTENALQANRDLKGIYGANASAPIGAARAIVAANLGGKVLVTGGGDLPETYPLITSGVISGVTAQRQWEIGYWSVRYLVALNQNHTIAQEHETGAFLMDKAALAQ